MAKTTSEIVAENVKKQKIAEELAKSIEENTDQVALSEAKAKTDAVLNGTSDKLVKADDLMESSAASVPTNIGVFVPSSFAIGLISFILGLLVMFIFCRIKIKKLKLEHQKKIEKIHIECDAKVNEARAALDRMLIIASKDS